MTGKVGLVYSDKLLKYDFGPSHSLQQIRMKLAYELIKSFGIFQSKEIKDLEPEIAKEEDILLVHSKEYVSKVKELSGSSYIGSYAWEYGLGTMDNPIFEDMYEASCYHAGATLMACDSVMEGKLDHVFSLGGGFHHAMEDRASGFCIFNDIAIGIKHLKEKYDIEKVLYVDIDAHHGDGVQRIFYSDPSVFTISLHEDGRFLFPGSGFVHEKGEGKGEGYAVNVPLPPYTRDDSYLYAFQEIVPPLAKAFQPDVLFTQLGADAHFSDPLTHLLLTTRSYEEVSKTFHEICHEVSKGKWIAVGGGGYEISTVPRIWALEFAAMIARGLSNEIPSSWLDLYAKLAGIQSSLVFLRDEKAQEKELSVSVAVKRVVQEVKKGIFSYHELFR